MSTTKTKIKWRLTKLPTPQELIDLTKAGLLKEDEAKEILFSLENDEDRDKESLKEEIKFLRELVQKLSNRSTIIENIKYVEKPYYRYDWYKPYIAYSSTPTTDTANTIYMTSGTSTYTLNSTAGASGDSLTVSYSGEPSFTDIDTFKLN